MITAENYITYFMLYVDDELTIEEQEMVMQFANSNNMYNETLAVLLQTKLQTTMPKAISKTRLLKPNIVSVNQINEENYYNYFTASVDNELTKQEEEDVTDFLYRNPVLETEYDWIEKTKLPEELVVYSNKKNLLRKEEKRRWVYYLQISSAAALLLIGMLFWFNRPTSSVEKNEIATNIPKVTVDTLQVPQQAIANNSEAIEKVKEKNKNQIVVEVVGNNIKEKYSNNVVVVQPAKIKDKLVQVAPEVAPTPKEDVIGNYAVNTVKHINDNDIIQPITTASVQADIKRVSYSGTAEINLVSNTTETNPVATRTQLSSRNKLKNKLLSKAKNLLNKLNADGDEKINIGPAFVSL